MAVWQELKCSSQLKVGQKIAAIDMREKNPAPPAFVVVDHYNHPHLHFYFTHFFLLPETLPAREITRGEAYGIVQ